MSPAQADSAATPHRLDNPYADHLAIADLIDRAAELR
jgi:hypothetical protein